MHKSVYEFFHRYTLPEYFAGKYVLEVGSKCVNGSVRPLIERFAKPATYTGIDIEPGEYVDILLGVEKLTQHFGEEAFDVIISTETLEHVIDWRVAVNEMKKALRKGGLLIVTTRSRGFPIHAYPYDTWRYEAEDFMKIFSDMEILQLIKDPEFPGVFMIARKPFNFKPVELSGIPLYSLILGKRTLRIPQVQEMGFFRRLLFKVMNIRAVFAIVNLCSAYIYRKKLGTLT